MLKIHYTVSRRLIVGISNLPVSAFWANAPVRIVLDCLTSRLKEDYALDCALAFPS
jgi:hypothetical protein